MPDRGHPTEELCSGGNHDHQARRREEAFAQLRQARGKHVVDPHAESKKSRGHDRDHDRRVSENATSRETVHQSGHNGGSGKKNDVNLGMSEEPEQVLVKENVAAFRGIKKLGAHQAVKQQQAARPPSPPAWRRSR